jgi:hypothetical protein
MPFCLNGVLSEQAGHYPCKAHTEGEITVQLLLYPGATVADALTTSLKIPVVNHRPQWAAFESDISR